MSYGFPLIPQEGQKVLRYIPPGRPQDLGVPQGSHEKASNFKPVSRPSKVMKIHPKDTRYRTQTLKLTDFKVEIS